MSDQCVAPEEIQDGDLMAFVDGRASRSVVAHVKACEFCQAVIAGLRQTDAIFTAALYRADCPDTETLLAVAAWQVTGAAREEVMAHVAGCYHCQQEVTELAAVPRRVAESNQGSWSERLKEQGKRLIEALRQPDAGIPAPAMRGEMQHLRYEAGEYALFLALTRPLVAQMSWIVQGQVSLLADGSTPVGGEAVLTRRQRVTASDKLDEFGYFVMEGVKGGQYSLHIDLADTRILVRELAIEWDDS